MEEMETRIQNVKLETIETNLGHQPSEVGPPTHHSFSVTPGQLDKITVSFSKKNKRKHEWSSMEIEMVFGHLVIGNWQFVIGNGKQAIGNNGQLELGNRPLVI